MESDTAKREFMEFKKIKEHEWYRFLIFFFLFLFISYITLHLSLGKKAQYEYEILEPAQLQQINRIYFDDSITKDGAGKDTTTSVRLSVPSTNSIIIKSEKVLKFIELQFNNKIDTQQLASIRPFLNTVTPLEAISFLSTFRFKVESYFWLVGPEVYLEIIFWSLFGVFASLLFNLGVVSRSRTTDNSNPSSIFDSSEIPYQVAKFFYAPLCTLAIILGYNYMTSENIVDISSSKGVIVFSFIGGFYSARLISFLDRLKEVLLPSSGTPELPAQRDAGDNTLNQIVIQLEPDETELPAEILNDVAEVGLNDSKVTLENIETGEMVTAENKGEDQSSTFVASRIKAGKYKITAAWSGNISDGPLNLYGVHTESIHLPETQIKIIMKKAESEG